MGDRYSRVLVLEEMAPSYGEVRYLDPADTSSVLRTISREALRAQVLLKEKAVEAALKLLEGPARKKRGRAMTFVGRKKKAAAA